MSQRFTADELRQIAIFLDEVSAAKANGLTHEDDEGNYFMHDKPIVIDSSGQEPVVVL